MTEWQHPTGKAPDTVHIVCAGYTAREYLAAVGVYGAQVPTNIEVWSLNKALRAIKADFGFVLDDIVGEHTKCATYVNDLGRIAYTVPILTTTIDEPATRVIGETVDNWYEYPITEIRNKLGRVFGEAYFESTGSVKELTQAHKRQFGNDLLYMKNSVPMMLAYAWFIGVKTIFLWGADYSHPAGQRREADQPNAEFWVGFLKGQGIQVVLSGDTTLCSTRDGKALYGYGARQPKL